MEIGLIAGIVSFVAGIFAYPHFIQRLQQQGLQQTPSEYALDEYKNKQKTVTFGGVLFVGIPAVIALIFNGYQVDLFLYLVIFIYIAYGLIGLIDDYKIVKEGRNDGLTPRMKMGWQLILALLFYGLYRILGGDTLLVIPFMKAPLDLGILYIPFVMFLFSGASNAVNLTDGMDGLAGGVSVIALIPFIIFAFHQQQMGLYILLASVLGTLVAFLFYNRKPAQIFMGDVGSLALGALFAAVSIILKKELLLAIIGGVFVFETVCVIIQRISWKLRKKRVFQYTPIHYSFTVSGWSEEDTVYLFYALGLMGMVLSFVLSVVS